VAKVPLLKPLFAKSEYQQDSSMCKTILFELFRTWQASGMFWKSPRSCVAEVLLLKPLVALMCSSPTLIRLAAVPAGTEARPSRVMKCKLAPAGQVFDNYSKENKPKQNVKQNKIIALPHVFGP
jgi:hypothetical protein